MKRFHSATGTNICLYSYCSKASQAVLSQLPIFNEHHPMGNFQSSVIKLNIGKMEKMHMEKSVCPAGLLHRLILRKEFQLLQNT